MQSMVTFKTRGTFRMQEIGGVDIFRPRPESDAAIRRKAEPNLRVKFAAGTYTDVKDVQAILHEQVAFFGDRFDDLITKLASRDLLEFVLWQYDETGRLDELRKEGRLKGEALRAWTNIGPTYRRALKYMAERTAMHAPNVDPKDAPSPDDVDELFICAEELISYCVTSDLTRIFPSTTTVVVQQERHPTYIDHSVSDLRLQELEQRIHTDAAERNKFFEQPNFEQDYMTHASIVDTALQDTIGTTHTSALSMLAILRDGCTADPAATFPTKFVLRSKVVDKLATVYGVSSDVVERVLDGFSLRKEDLIARAKGDKDFWHPGFHHRAYRRALFCMPHELGAHIAFGDRMFEECWVIMQAEVCYGQYPDEWRSDAVTAALGTVVRKRGEWFEEQVRRNLSTIGIEGLASRTRIGKDGASIVLPGEFDFIGWSDADQALVLFEDKMLQHGAEPRLWKNQIDAFLRGTKKEEAYLTKLKRKTEWLKENAAAVCDALRSEGVDVKVAPVKVLSGFLTYTPSPASYFIDDFPCVAVSEFMTDYLKAKMWPYQNGSLSLV